MARFRVTDRGPVREGEGRLTPVEAAEPPPPGAVLAGDGAELLWKTVPGLSRWSGTGTQRAAAAARLGARARSTETMHSPEPRYARAADARPRRR